ncbi:MAG: FKBP-type peptidyl-prolyl cis-trans isomerase [Candidatus Saccharimonadales bacterium]
MSTTRLRDRIFAGLGALLFLVTASAFTIGVVIDMMKKKPVVCDIQTPEKSSIQAAPEVYKPQGVVKDLEKTDLVEGKGAMAKKGDCLVMKYQGNLASDGTVFDGNYNKAQALQFSLGQGQVIKGWDEGLEGMKVGGTRRLAIPAAMGYGEGGQGAIPANADLVFIVKLERIKTN